MANRRAERIEIAGVEGVPRCADHLVYHSVAMFRYAIAGRNDGYA